MVQQHACGGDILVGQAFSQAHRGRFEGVLNQQSAQRSLFQCQCLSVVACLDFSVKTVKVSLNYPLFLFLRLHCRGRDCQGRLVDLPQYPSAYLLYCVQG